MSKISELIAKLYAGRFEDEEIDRLAARVNKLGLSDEQIEVVIEEWRFSLVKGSDRLTDLYTRLKGCSAESRLGTIAKTKPTADQIVTDFVREFPQQRHGHFTAGHPPAIKGVRMYPTIEDAIGWAWWRLENELHCTREKTTEHVYAMFGDAAQPLIDRKQALAEKVQARRGTLMAEVNVVLAEQIPGF